MHCCVYLFGQGRTPKSTGSTDHEKLVLGAQRHHTPSHLPGQEFCLAVFRGGCITSCIITLPLENASTCYCSCWCCFEEAVSFQWEVFKDIHEVPTLYILSLRCLILFPGWVWSSPSYASTYDPSQPGRNPWGETVSTSNSLVLFSRLLLSHGCEQTRIAKGA